MSLRLQWLSIAEGAVFDSRRALSLVGIDQNVLYQDKFPIQWQTNIIVLASEDADDLSESPDSGSISIEIRDPSDARISATASKIVLERKHKELPGSFVAVALVGIQLTRQGRYRIVAELTPDGSTEPSSVLSKDIFVLPKEKQDN